MKTFKDFNEIEKEEIITFAKANGFTIAQNKYGIWAETIRYHADKKHKELVKKKSNKRHKDNKDNIEYKKKRKEIYQKRLESGIGPHKWKEWYEKNISIIRTTKLGYYEKTI